MEPSIILPWPIARITLWGRKIPENKGMAGRYFFEAGIFTEKSIRKA